MPFGYSVSSRRTWTLRPLPVLLAAIRLMITWCEISGLPRQFIEM